MSAMTTVEKQNIKNARKRKSIKRENETRRQENHKRRESNLISKNVGDCI